MKYSKNTPTESTIAYETEMPTSKTYSIRDRETGNVLDTFTSLGEALDMVMEWEFEDKKNGFYTPDFYEII